MTLTCISTGGPATTVTWTRDSTILTEGIETVLNDPVTAHYTHTLTVTGRIPGLYACTVANNKPSSDSATIIVSGIHRNWDCLEWSNHCMYTTPTYWLWLVNSRILHMHYIVANKKPFSDQVCCCNLIFQVSLKFQIAFWYTFYLSRYPSKWYNSSPGQCH